MARIMPEPQLYIHGAAIPTAGGQATTTNVAVDDLVLTWGRRAEDENVVAAIATARIWVPLGDLDFTVGIVGQTMRLQWTWGAETFVFFQGRVNAYKIAVGPRPKSPEAFSRGFIVTVTGSDKITDVVNVGFGPNTLSHDDTMIIRANLIKNAANSGGIDLEGVYFEPQTVNWPCGIYDTNNTNLRQWLDAFYMSLGNWWTYCHDQNAIRAVRRWTDPTARHWRAYVDNDNRQMITYHPLSVEYDGITYQSSMMPGRECFFDGPAELDSGTTSSINTVAAHWIDHADVEHMLVTTPGGYQRRMTYDSWLSSENIVAQVNNDLYSLYGANMYNPKLPPITWDTSVGGGFLGVSNAKCMTRAYENPGEITIGGSPLTGGLGARNVIQAAGGVIRYVEDHWEITVNPKWCGNWAIGTPITWNNMPAGWPFDNPNGAYLDPGLTAWDMYDMPDKAVYQGDA